ncbi:Lariat debranching enzyme [Pseudocercospora fuligena]|uniref:Lariat debranching enzyme n=1 Tax=Pseudocercospora fuligena TaxID=685502 RepID=A0A8H6RAF8_9PEZI|nr:Lariat debranching enzyme [Pseudocercospora fuligena]
MSSELRIAIEGCGHGTLHAIYASIEEACKQKGWDGIDLLIIGGDFQSVRNAFDLNTISMPAKYRSMCDFHEYYSGQRLAPYLTIFVGGNHEASSYLTELYYGGWVGPNIYYMGAANVLRLGPLRIAGLSGIWKGFDYRKPHFERLPYNESDLKSVYHVRELDVRKLLQIGTQVDVAISHDWPQGIEWKGNHKQLFRFKPHFEEDAKSGRLGSVAAKQVLERLRPKYWFSAHLHCKYAAVVHHNKPDGPTSSTTNGASATVTKTNEDEIDLDTEDVANGVKESQAVRNTDEIDLDLDDDVPAPATSITAGAAVAQSSKNADEIDIDLDDDMEVPAPALNGQHKSEAANGVHDTLLAEARAALPAAFNRPPPPEEMEHPKEISNHETNFLALDKCLPSRHFLQLMAIPSEVNVDRTQPLKLQYDREWLAIQRAFSLTEPPEFGNPDARVPFSKTQAEYRDLIDQQREWIDRNINEDDLAVPENFVVTAPVYDGGDFQDPRYQHVLEYPNPQTAAYCSFLQIPNALAISEEELHQRQKAGPREEPEAFGSGRGRGRGGFDRGRGRGGRGGRGRGGGRGRFRGR